MMTKDELQRKREDAELDYLLKTINEQLIGIAKADTAEKQKARTKYMRNAIIKYLKISRERIE